MRMSRTNIEKKNSCLVRSNLTAAAPSEAASRADPRRMPLCFQSQSFSESPALQRPLLLSVSGTVVQGVTWVSLSHTDSCATDSFHDQILITGSYEQMKPLLLFCSPVLFVRSGFKGQFCASWRNISFYSESPWPQ